MSVRDHRKQATFPEFFLPALSTAIRSALRERRISHIDWCVWPKYGCLYGFVVELLFMG
jgi:hypothetical protein